MRYYSNDYQTKIMEESNTVKESVDESDYYKSISNVVPYNYVFDASVTECLEAAKDAQTRITKAKKKLDALRIRLDFFYFDANAAATSVCTTANEINQIITEANIILQNLDDALNSTGKYQGRPVTIRSINDAGSSSRYIRLKKKAVWDTVLQLSKDISPNGELIACLADRLIKKLTNGEPITDNEKSYIDTFAMQITEKVKKEGIACRVRYLPVLNEMYKYYKLNRYDSFVNVLTMPEEPLKACISVYEILNPLAAQVMNSFFEPAMKNSKYDSKITASNIEIIKYELYTAGTRERQLVLAYLPYLELKALSGDKTSEYDPNSGVISLNMEKDCRTENDLDCGFFHEFGHGLDDLLFENETGPWNRTTRYVSYKYCSDIYDDFYTVFETAVENRGYKLSEKDLSTLYFLLISQDNVNVSKPDDHKYYKKLISGNKKVKKAYNDLRKYFGYRDYIFDEAGATFTIEPHEGIIDMSDETVVAGDLIGGITNNKLGAVGDSHAINPDSPSQPEIKNAKDLKKYLTNNSYWTKVKYFTYERVLFVIKISDTDGQPLCAEFFANSFEDRIHGVDQTRNKKLFPTAINDFENTLDETLADVYGDPQ